MRWNYRAGPPLPSRVYRCRRSTSAPASGFVPTGATGYCQVRKPQSRSAVHYPFSRASSSSPFVFLRKGNQDPFQHGKITHFGLFISRTIPGRAESRWEILNFLGGSINVEDLPVAPSSIPSRYAGEEYTLAPYSPTLITQKLFSFFFFSIP